MGAVVTESQQPDPRVPASPRIHPAIAPAGAVLFDFDYTLADSSEGIVVCMNHALGRLGLARAPEDAIRRTIGLDPREALGILAGEEWRSREDEFLEHFVRKADEVMLASTTFLPGAARVLRTLRDDGYKVGIVTTKYRRRVVDALERDALEALVDVDRRSGRCAAAQAGSRRTAAGGRFAGDPDRQLHLRRRFGGGCHGGPGTARVAFVAVLSGTTEEEVFARYPVRVVLGGVGELVGGRG